MSKRTLRKNRAKNPKKKTKKRPKSIQSGTKTASKAKTTPNPKPGTRAFIKLQTEWYSKLADEGFDDIEKANFNTGEALHLMQGHSLYNLGRAYNPDVLHNYRRWDCFIVHNPRFAANAMHIAAAKLFAEGSTYREMSSILRAQYGRGTSVQRIFELIAKLQLRVLQWNRQDHRGLDYQADIG